MGKVVIHLNEALFGGDKQLAGALKQIVSEEKISIEPKHHAVLQIENYAKLMISSNDSFAIPVDPGERRFFFLDVASSYVGNKKYFQDLVDEIKSGGREGFLHALLNTDTSNFNPKYLPETQTGGFDNKIECANSVLQYLHTCLTEETSTPDSNSGDWTDKHKSRTLYTHYVMYCETRKLRLLGDKQFGTILNQLFGKYGFERVQKGSACTRCWYYQFPTIEKLRKAFSEHFKTDSKVVFPD
jgi:phage/plasmid-associated DNA primase